MFFFPFYSWKDWKNPTHTFTITHPLPYDSTLQLWVFSQMSRKTLLHRSVHAQGRVHMKRGLTFTIWRWICKQWSLKLSLQNLHLLLLFGGPHCFSEYSHFNELPFLRGRKLKCTAEFRFSWSRPSFNQSINTLNRSNFLTGSVCEVFHYCLLIKM